MFCPCCKLARIRLNRSDYNVVKCSYTDKTPKLKTTRNMSSNKKTSSISFRIDQEYEKVLRSIAEKNKISLNTLANQIFGNYVEFEIYAKKFGTLRMSTDTFRRMIKNMDDKEIMEVATRCGSQEIKELFCSNGIRLTQRL